MTTNRIAYQIQESAVFREDECDHVSELLQSVKAITDDREKRTFHFRFFTRAEAARGEAHSVPFWKANMVLRNIRDALGTELPASEVKRYQIAYQLRVSNVAEHVSVHHLHEFLKAASDNTVAEFKSADRGGRDSHLSTKWTARFTTPHCPKILDGKTHIDWMGHYLFVQHYRVGRGLPCQVCHHMGHTTSACVTPERARKLKHLSVRVSAHDLAAPPPPRTFANELELVGYLFAGKSDQTPRTTPVVAWENNESSNNVADAAAE